MVPFIDIDAEGLKRIGDELGASTKQISMAQTRALRRTAGWMRRRLAAGLRDELQLRRAATMRKRLRGLKMRVRKDAASIGVWVGLNNLPVSAFKGRPRKVSGGIEARGQVIGGAFFGTAKSGRREVFRRVGEKRLPIAVATIPIKDPADIFIEDVLYEEAAEVFMRNFRSDLRARTIYGVGER